MTYSVSSLSSAVSGHIPWYVWYDGIHSTKYTSCMLVPGHEVTHASWTSSAQNTLDELYI